MIVSSFTKEDKKELKKIMRPSIVLAIVFFIAISATNFTFYYRDILTDTEGLQRPPFMQLVLIEVFAFVLAFITFYFLSKSLLKDLGNGKKNVEHQEVSKKYVKMNNGERQYLLLLKNNITAVVNKTFYAQTSVGEKVMIEYTPKAIHVFKVERAA